MRCIATTSAGEVIDILSAEPKTPITDLPVEKKRLTSLIALLRDYIAYSFAPTSHGAMPTSWVESPVPPLISVPRG
jgi:hypothetical protein